MGAPSTVWMLRSSYAFLSLWPDSKSFLATVPSFIMYILDTWGNLYKIRLKYPKGKWPIIRSNSSLKVSMCPKRLYIKCGRHFEASQKAYFPRAAQIIIVRINNNKNCRHVSDRELQLSDALQQGQNRTIRNYQRSRTRECVSMFLKTAYNEYVQVLIINKRSPGELW